jgi:hypothetical protein
MVNCSYPPCLRPTLASNDSPGINCSLPVCSQPLATNDVPRVNCLLPVCNGAIGDIPEVNCSLRACNIPLNQNDSPGVNCSLPLCSQPLSGYDKPGINCQIRTCTNLGRETAGLDCILPSCASGVEGYKSLATDINPNPGVNCLYAVKHRIGTVMKDVLVPVCSGSKINSYNIKNGDYLYSEWLYDTLQYKKEELQHKKYKTFFNYLINDKEHYFGETYNINNGDLSNTELIPLNDKYVELFLQKKELEKQLKEIEMEIIKYF